MPLFPSDSETNLTRYRGGVGDAKDSSGTVYLYGWRISFFYPTLSEFSLCFPWVCPSLVTTAEFEGDKSMCGNQPHQPINHSAEEGTCCSVNPSTSTAPILPKPERLMQSSAGHVPRMSTTRTRFLISWQGHIQTKFPVLLGYGQFILPKWRYDTKFCPVTWVPSSFVYSTGLSIKLPEAHTPVTTRNAACVWSVLSSAEA